MDPVTHGIIGLGISAISGEPITASNPIVLGCVIGAMAPDIDVITKYKGDYQYLKHHRGFSHSIIGLGIISAVISLGLHLMFQDYSFTSIFLWTFFGSISHTLFDFLNSYGVRCLLPFNKRKYSASLLMLYDPFITLLSIGLALTEGSSLVKGAVGLILLTGYLTIRFLLKIRVKRKLEDKFSQTHNIVKVNVLPAMINPLKWDFVIETKSHNIVGQAHSFFSIIKIRKELEKNHHNIIEFLQHTELGRYFLDFTPISHVKVIENGEKILLKVIDLRYFFRNNFMHHATIVLDRNMGVIREIFHPYNPENKILVNSRKAA